MVALNFIERYEKLLAKRECTRMSMDGHIIHKFFGYYNNSLIYKIGATLPTSRCHARDKQPTKIER